MAKRKRPSPEERAGQEAEWREGRRMLEERIAYHQAKLREERERAERRRRRLQRLFPFLRLSGE